MEARIAEIESGFLPDNDSWQVQAAKRERERKIEAIRAAGARGTSFGIAVNAELFRDLLKKAVADVVEIGMSEPLTPIAVQDTG